MKHLLRFAFACLPLASAWSDDLTIREAVVRGLQNRPSLQAAFAETAAALEGLRVARSRRGPQLSANGFWSSSKEGAILGSSPGVMPATSMGVPGGSFGVANLMLMVPLFTGGLLDSQVRSASFGLLASQGEESEMRAEAAQMVREAYLMALEAQAMAEAEEARLVAATEAVRTTRARFEAGKDIGPSVSRAEAELAMAQRELNRARNERAKSILELQAAMGEELGGEIVLADRLEMVALTESLDDRLKQAQSQRGKLVAARARLEAAAANVRAVEGALRPQVYGAAMADGTSDRMMGGPTVALTVSLPIFDSGERRAEVRRMRAMRDAAAAILRDAELQVAKEVRQAWLDVSTAAENARSAEASVRSSLAAYETVATRTAAGVGILVEQLDALQVLTQARAELAAALSEHGRALARLDFASGTIPGGSR